MKIAVYGTKECPNCHTVADWLHSNNLPYSYQLIPDDITPVQVSEIVGRNVRSVPVIVLNGKEKTFDELKDEVSKMATFDEVTKNLFDLTL